MKKHLFIPAVVAVSGLCGCSFDYGDNYYVGDYFPEVAGENYAEYEENPFVSTALQPVSTFSVDADGGSFANVRRILNQGCCGSASGERILMTRNGVIPIMYF